ncbi:MAG: hypothetical protein AAGA54_28240 [Myxococcota bacterium]
MTGIGVQRRDEFVGSPGFGDGEDADATPSPNVAEVTRSDSASSKDSGNWSVATSAASSRSDVEHVPQDDGVHGGPHEYPVDGGSTYSKPAVLETPGPR